MPGTIQVSVFDLMGLPSSSSSIKVSMGSKEHQIWDKGVFSFPLTTLREDLFVTLFNIDGVELSRTGVNTKIVVEKGVWDDIFPLEGGGHLHMKLQFILSKEDRNRIREMRETALKKKREELLLSSKRRSETEALSKVANDIMVAFNHQVTDSQGSIVQREAVSGAGRANSESNPKESKNFRLQYSTPSKTDGEAESSKEHRALTVVKPFKEQEVNLTETHRVVDNMVTKLPPNGVSARPISSEDSVRYATIPRKLRMNEIDAAEETSLEVVPSQEQKALHVAEANQNVPLTIVTWSPPNDIIPRHSSLSSLSTIKQIDREEIPRSNQTTREGTPSEANRQVPVNMDNQSPTSSITSIGSSLLNITDSTSVRIALEKAVRNNETDSDETSKANPKAAEKIDIQLPPNSIVTQPKYPHNQIHSFASHIGSENTFRNNVIDGEGASSPTKPLEEIKAFDQRETTPQVTEKTDSQSPQDVIPNRFIASKEYLRSSKFLLGRKSYSTSNLLEASRTSTNENQTAQKRTPSNVRNMISAFENSLPQEPQLRPTALKLTPNLSKVSTEVHLKVPSENEAATRNKETKEQNIGTQLKPYSLKKPLEVNVQQNVSQISKVDKGTPLKETNINISKEKKNETDKIIVGRELDPFSVRKTLAVNAHRTALDDGLPNSQSTENLEPRAAAVEENNSSEQVHAFMEHKKDNVSRQDISLKEITVTSEPETATLSGRAFDHPAQKEYSPTERIHGQEGLSGEVSVPSETDTASISGRNPDDPVTRVLRHEQQGSSHNMIDKPENINTPGIPLRKRKSLEYLGVEQFHSHDMESWILPDERKHVCITTGDKKMMYVAGCFDTSSERNRMDINSGDEETKVAMDSETSNEVVHTETESCDLMESKIERQRNDGFFAGPIGQAVRIALMVAFGTLVVVARQTRNR